MTVKRLEEQSWSDVAEYLQSDERIIIPVGSTEQHGCFAPLGTDTYAALSIAEGASGRTGVLMAPPLWFGWSPHHLVRPGTVTVRAEVLIEVLADVVASLAEHGFRNFVVVNGHRIVNIPWMQIAAERCQRELGVRVRLFDPAYMSKQIVTELGFGGIGHAEEIEISHMLAYRPDLVDLERAVDNPHSARDLYHLDPGDPRDTLCYVPATRDELDRVLTATGDTVGGCPSKSSADKGRRYQEHLIGRLVEVLEAFKG